MSKATMLKTANTVHMEKKQEASAITATTAMTSEDCWKDFWAEVEKLKILSKAAIVYIPESLSDSTKKSLMLLKPDKAAEIISATIREIDNGSVETMENLLRKKLGFRKKLEHEFGKKLGFGIFGKILNSLKPLNSSLNPLQRFLKPWEDLPDFMKVEEVRPYWEILNKKRGQLLLKRIFDLTVSLILLLFLALPMAVIAVLIKLDSPGPVLYRQERVTTYGKHFHIHKFRTMVNNAEKIGTSVTVGHDSRITKLGAKLRGLRLDELPQVFDVIRGDMSFVGTRPEAVKYVEKYKPEYFATLLMPAGITSEASIRYKDEDKLLSVAATDDANNVDKVYIQEVLPAKMVWNLESIRRFRFLRELLTMMRTVLAVLGKNYQ